MKPNSQQQPSSRHYNQRGFSNSLNLHHGGGSGGGGGAVPLVSLQPQQPQQPSGGQHPQQQQQQQINLYGRNNQYLNQPVDMPPPETVVARLETACRLLHGIGVNNTRVAEISAEIQILSEDLRRVGPHLELSYPDVLDRVMSSMRDASAQPFLPPHLRLAIFELVELRASKWLLPSDSSNYYRQRRTGHEEDESPDHASQSQSKLPSGSGNAGGSSALQEKSDGKTYREEILIKNSDSGKVSATAKERVLSINGYSQQSINLAKSLIHDTINRNASPVFDASAAAAIDKKIAGTGGHGTTIGITSAGGIGSPGLCPTNLDSGKDSTEPSGHCGAGGGDVNVCQYNYTVAINDETIKVSGDNFQLVQEAKLALDDYFSSRYNLYPEMDLEEIESSAVTTNGQLSDSQNTSNTAGNEIPSSNTFVPASPSSGGGCLDNKSNCVNNVSSSHETTGKPSVKSYSRAALYAIGCQLTNVLRPNFSHLDQSVQDNIILKTPKRTEQVALTNTASPSSASSTSSSSSQKK